MRVAFYNHTCDVSGAEISLILTAKHLTKAEPIIFAPEGELLALAREAGLKAVPLPSYRARLSRNPLRILKDAIGMLNAGFKFARMVRHYRADLIHANSLRAGIMAGMFVWLHRCPLVWHVRDIPPSGLIGRGIGAIAAISANAVIGISKSVMQKLAQRRLTDKMHLVHNGVEVREISDFERRVIRNKIREELLTPREGKVVAIIGQIAPWKRQQDALLAAKELIDQGHDIVLWIVGEAKFREEHKVYLESLKAMTKRMGIEKRVRFTGHRTDVMEICCAADLLFLCSDHEPFGRVIIEAMSQAVPVIATNAGGVPEIIEHERTGLLYEVADVKGLVQNADHLLGNDKLRKEMGIVAAQRVKERFTIQGTAAKIEKIYTNIAIERDFS